MTTRKTILFGFLFSVGLACNTAYKAEENTGKGARHVEHHRI